MSYKDAEKQREYQKNWVKNRKMEFFKNKRCSTWWCGDTKDLELDHIDPNLKVHHSIWSWSKEKIETELVKCQILCRRCHINKTVWQTHGHEPYKHGTTRQYNNGCRCINCKSANTNKVAKWRAGLAKR